MEGFCPGTFSSQKLSPPTFTSAAAQCSPQPAATTQTQDECYNVHEVCKSLTRGDVKLDDKDASKHSLSRTHARTHAHTHTHHWAKTYIPTTLGIHWVCIVNVLKPAN